MRPQRRDAWVPILGAAAVAEAHALWAGNDGTLCAFIRAVFHTDTPEGRAAFTVGLIIAGICFWLHIIKPFDQEATP